MPETRHRLVALLAIAPVALATSLTTSLMTTRALAQDTENAGHFGFDGLEVVKIDPKAGPVALGDFDGDGREDLAIANNFKSRIELHVQKPGATPDDPAALTTAVNEVPPHWRFRRIEIPVSHQINAIAPFDFNGDGLLDIIYAGQPGTIVFLRQTKPGVFEVERRIPQKGLTQSRDGFVVADLVGDAKPDLAAIVAGQVMVWPMDGSKLGDPIELASGDAVVALLVGDFDGDGSNDLVGVAPESTAPVRLWLASSETAANGATMKRLGSQRRFEMPPLREVTALRLPGAKKDLLARIERQSKRVVVEELVEDASGSRDAALEVFSAASGKKRTYAVGDVDGDGLSDVIASDPTASAVTIYRQQKGRGLQPGVAQPSFAEIDAVALGDVDGKPGDEVFVLSEKEGVVGRSAWSNGALSFPTALPLSPGATPAVLSLVRLESGPRAAVVTKDGRNYQLELLPVAPVEGGASPASEVIKLGALVKGPDAVLALDADQDGRTDLLLFTTDKPMSMLQSVEKDGKSTFELRESKDMAQFGLAQAANAGNSVAFDVDGDGKKELVVADRNFIRALRYAPSANPPGWQVIAQMNASRPDAKLVALTVRGDELVAADRENNELAVFAKSAAGAWAQSDEHPVTGFKFGPVRAGNFSGGTSADVLLVGDDGFAIARLDGGRLQLEERANFRADRTQQVDHELTAGDVNGDGFLDLVALDAGEQTLGILSFSESGNLLPMTRFKVFETRLFQAGEPREFEPSMALVGDLTGDGANDIILLCHDRVLLYPQSPKPLKAQP
ncbi:MAG: VCBS repeat-containing protein [Limnohabitans sp.]|nr:VCBS repeat-containing protein [Limnohabitans sp.]